MTKRSAKVMRAQRLARMQWYLWRIERGDPKVTLMPRGGIIADCKIVPNQSAGIRL